MEFLNGRNLKHRLINLPVGTRLLLAIVTSQRQSLHVLITVNFLVFTVMKFKQKPRFLEFFTQVMLKCMHDEKFHLMVEITNPVYDFLKRYL